MTYGHSIDYSVAFREDGVKQFRRVSRAPRWQKSPLLDFRSAVLVPEKGRAIRFAILMPQIGEEIEEVNIGFPAKKSDFSAYAYLHLLTDFELFILPKKL